MNLLKTILKFEAAPSDPELEKAIYKKKPKDDDIYKGGGGSGGSSGLALRTALLAAGIGGAV